MSLAFAACGGRRCSSRRQTPDPNHFGAGFCTYAIQQTINKFSSGDDIEAEIEVNSHRHVVEIAPRTPLLYALRNDLKLDGPEFGCGLAQCGACTVHVDDKAVRACVTPVSTAVGKKNTTIEVRPGHGGKAAPGAGRLHRRTGGTMRLLPQMICPKHYIFHREYN